jgi:hypothetical protein
MLNSNHHDGIRCPDLLPFRASREKLNEGSCRAARSSTSRTSTSSGNIGISTLAPQAAQAERHRRRAQVGRGSDITAPLVEGDADLKPVVTHWYLAHPA